MCDVVALAEFCKLISFCILCILYKEEGDKEHPKRDLEKEMWTAGFKTWKRLASDSWTTYFKVRQSDIMCVYHNY